MALSLLGCFKPRQARLSESGITSLVAKKHSAVAAIITGLSSSAAETISRRTQAADEIPEPNLNIIRASPFCDGLGILIYPSLLLTTHSTIPSPLSALDAEINLRYSDTSLNILRRKFLPELFFATDAKLNVTVIACEFVNPEMHPLGLDTSKVDMAAYEVGSKVYVLGHDRNKGSPIKLSVGCGYNISSFNCPDVAIRSRGEAWLRGSAGFDHKGNFALMVTDSDYENAKALKNACVSIHSIKSWLEPQWQASKTDSASTPRPRASLLYTRRATYSGPESGACLEACVKEFDIKKANGNGKVTHCSSVVLRGENDKSLMSSGGEGGGQFAASEAVGVGAINGKVNAGKEESGEEEDGKVEGMKREVMRKVSSMKEEMYGRGPGRMRNTVKVVQVTNEATGSSLRSANDSNVVKAGKVKSDVAVMEGTHNKKKGGAPKLGGPKVHMRASMDNRRAKPTLHQAFQRDRASLQLRLHDIPIKDQLSGT